jgi:hypothetical protein
MDEPKVVQCPECGGTRKVPLLHLDNLPGPSSPLQIDCPTCGGTELTGRTHGCSDHRAVVSRWY